ncbi:ABC transporter substrate-binding protein [Microbacterium halotolerans]|uniref:ABC transporter substrate-binding protein n=1 Tax=Microbacterium halotolerans TaxID=246613 RepID=UPI000E6AA076|nr:ABC transporter substrate-binding protein [Microbacterium halotolerans]
MTYRLRRTTAIIAGAATIALATTLTACGPDGGASEQNAEGEQTITIAALATANMAPIYIGIEQGFFDEVGIDLEVQTVQSGSEMITGAVGGTFDIICGGYVPVYTAISQGLPLKFIAGNDVGGATPDVDWQVVVAGADSPVQDADDLATATIGVNVLKGVAEIQVRSSLENQGIDDADVELTEIPFPEMPAALEQGHLDAALVPEPFVTQVLDAGGRVVDTPYANLGADFPNGAYQATEQFIAENSEAVEGYVQAITKSIEFATDNPDEVRAAIPTFTQVPEDVAERMRLPVFNAELDMDRMMQLLDFTEEYGTIEERPSADDLIHTP